MPEGQTLMSAHDENCRSPHRFDMAEMSHDPALAWGRCRPQRDDRRSGFEWQFPPETAIRLALADFLAR
jgi:hypothetical protein